MKKCARYFLPVVLIVVLLISVSCELAIIQQFTVVYDGNGNTGGTIPCYGVTAAAGTSFEVEGNTGGLSRTGYDFDGWNTKPDGSGYSPQVGTSFVMPASNPNQMVTFYAQWQPKNYSLTFDSNGGTCSENSRAITYDHAYGTLPKPTRTGYRFLGWFTSIDPIDGQQVHAQTIHQVAQDVTVHAQWLDFVDAPYTVNYYLQDLNTEGYVLFQTITLYTTIGMTAVAEELEFDGFSLFEAHPSHISSGEVMETGLLELHLFYTRNIHTVTFNSAGGTPVSQKTVRWGTPVQLPEIARTGYTFGGWWTSPDGGGTGCDSTHVVTDDIDLYAKWTANTYSVTFDMQGGTGGSPSVDATYDSTMPAATAPTRAGYLFRGYYDAVNGGGKQYYTDAMASVCNWDKLAATTLYAFWDEYEVGDIGPAGGLIFYVKGSFSDGWRYLEAAPADIAVDGSVYFHIFGFHRNTPAGSSVLVGTATGIGTGQANTTALVAAMGSAAYTSPSSMVETTTGDYAARLCANHVVETYDDWFLPSKDELHQMYQNLKLNELGGFSDGAYWSSSEYDATFAWYIAFSNETISNIYKSYTFSVRPVRAF